MNEETNKTQKNMLSQLIQLYLNELEESVSGMKDKLTLTVQYPHKDPTVSECIEILEHLGRISSSTTGFIIYTSNLMKQQTRENK